MNSWSLSSVMLLSSYKTKMKTSINSRIKQSGTKLSLPIAELLLRRIQMWSNLFSHLFSNACLSSAGAEPTPQCSSLNSLSVPLLIVTLHPQWSAKAFFFLARWKEVATDLAQFWAADSLPNLFSLKSQMIHSGNVQVPSMEEIRKIISSLLPQFPPSSWCLHFGSSQKVYYPVPQIFFQE